MGSARRRNRVLLPTCLIRGNNGKKTDDNFVEKLIAEVESRKFIWDAKDKHHKESGLVETAWVAIARNLDDRKYIEASDWDVVLNTSGCGNQSR